MLHRDVAFQSAADTPQMAIRSHQPSDGQWPGPNPGHRLQQHPRTDSLAEARKEVKLSIPHFLRLNGPADSIVQAHGSQT